MKRYPILAEFVDVHTGQRHLKGGDPFQPKDAEQLRRLVDAKCLGKDPAAASDKPVADMSRAELEAAAIDGFTAEIANASIDELRDGVTRLRERESEQRDLAEISRQQINEDGLFEQTVDQLKDLAQAEEVDLAGVTLKADIVAAIRGKRATA